MHVCTYAHTTQHTQHTHTHTNKHTHTYTHIHTHQHTQTHAHTHTHIHNTYTHIHTHQHTHTHTHTQTHTHTHTHTPTHTHTNTHTHFLISNGCFIYSVFDLINSSLFEIRFFWPKKDKMLYYHLYLFRLSTRETGPNIRNTKNIRNMSLSLLIERFYSYWSKIFK